MTSGVLVMEKKTGWTESLTGEPKREGGGGTRERPGRRCSINGDRVIRRRVS